MEQEESPRSEGGDIEDSIFDYAYYLIVWFLLPYIPDQQGPAGMGEATEAISI